MRGGRSGLGRCVGAALAPGRVRGEGRAVGEKRQQIVGAFLGDGTF